MNGRLDMVKALIDHGADPKICDTDGQTIADYARDAGQEELLEVLAN